MVHDFLAPCPCDFVPSTLANLQRPSITLSKPPSAVTIFSPCFVFRKVIDLKFMHGRTCVATFNLSLKDILREHLLQFSLEKMCSFQQPDDWCHRLGMDFPQKNSLVHLTKLSTSHVAPGIPSRLLHPPNHGKQPRQVSEKFMSGISKAVDWREVSKHARPIWRHQVKTEMLALVLCRDFGVRTVRKKRWILQDICEKNTFLSKFSATKKGTN